MGHISLIILLLIAFFTLSFTPFSYYTVKYVYDGDTILIDNGEKVRYLGIDAPEFVDNSKNNNVLAEKSKILNIQMVKGQKVRLEFDQDKRDQYGRLLAYVFYNGTEMINGVLIKQGLAHVMVKNNDLIYFQLLLKYQRQAMVKRIGIWQYDSPYLENFYLGSKKSFRFHRPSCPFGKKISKHNIVRFKNRTSAFWEGFSPCEKCLP